MNHSETPDNRDIVIIGSGQAASPLAHDAAAAGWKVSVIEEAHPGGTCINTGCTPTKTLVASARAAYMARSSADWGIEVGEVKVDWPAVRGRRDKIVEEFRAGSRRGLTETEGIDYIEGHARFIGPGELEISSGETADLSSRRIKAHRIVLDVGGRSLIPDIQGLDSINWVDSAGIQTIDALPRHLVVLGGGYIGLEFGQMFHRFGCEVTIVHRGEHLLSREDEDVAREMEKVLAAEGLRIITGACPDRVEPDSVDSGGGFTLNLQPTPGRSAGKGESSISGDLLLIAVGRSPNTGDLGLESAGIETDRRGFIAVDDNLAATAEGVWAVGDCKGGPSFTHIAYDDYRILRDTWFGTANGSPDGSPGGKPLRTGISGRPVPYTVFTDPQLGRIGLSEKEAAAAGIAADVYSIPFTWVARALETGETGGLMKILASPDDGHILGAAVLGMEGGELATMLQLAMAGGLTVADLKETIFPHPGLAEAFNNLIAYGKRT